HRMIDQPPLRTHRQPTRQHHPTRLRTLHHRPQPPMLTPPPTHPPPPPPHPPNPPPATSPEPGPPPDNQNRRRSKAYVGNSTQPAPHPPNTAPQSTPTPGTNIWPIAVNSDVASARSFHNTDADEMSALGSVCSIAAISPLLGPTSQNRVTPADSRLRAESANRTVSRT